MFVQYHSFQCVLVLLCSYTHQDWTRRIYSRTDAYAHAHAPITCAAPAAASSKASNSISSQRDGELVECAPVCVIIITIIIVVAWWPAQACRRWRWQLNDRRAMCCRRRAVRAPAYWRRNRRRAALRTTGCRHLWERACKTEWAAVSWITTAVCVCVRGVWPQTCN